MGGNRGQLATVAGGGGPGNYIEGNRRMTTAKNNDFESPLSKARRLALHMLHMVEECACALGGEYQGEDMGAYWGEDDPNLSEEERADSKATMAWLDEAGVWGDIVRKCGQILHDADDKLWEFHHKIGEPVWKQLKAEEEDREARKAAAAARRKAREAAKAAKD